jgi:hypothetical protein
MSHPDSPPQWTPPTPPSRSANINDYAPPKLGVGWIILIIVVAAALIAGLFFLTTPQRTVQPTASPTPTPSVTETPPWGLPFVGTNESCTGQWDVLSSKWTVEGLEVQLRVVSDNCPLILFFSAVDKEDAMSHDPMISPGFMEMGGLQLQPGDDRTGTLVFRMERSEVSLMMSDDSYTQLSAIDVEG